MSHLWYYKVDYASNSLLEDSIHQNIVQQKQNSPAIINEFNYEKFSCSESNYSAIFSFSTP
jgi:hypothetical protein